MLKGREHETKVQSTFETSAEYWRNEWRRAKGKPFSFFWFRFRWNKFPRWRVVPNFPLNVDIEVSSVCNLKCDHCFRQYMDIRENALMPMDMYRKVVAECGRHGLFTLKFSMRGEPTMHPELPEMVAFAKKSGVKEVWINTHGGNITESLAERLMKAGVDWVTMSFDGLGEMYESIRKPMKYEKALDNLRILSEARDRYNPGAMLNAQSLWSAIRHDPETYLKTMRQYVDRVSYNQDMNYAEEQLVPDDSFVCPRLWQRLAVTSSGLILKCPSDFRMEEPLGSVNDMTIKQAWDIAQGAQRKGHLEGRKKESPVCQRCHHGAKKQKRETTEDKAMDTFSIVYKDDFQGHGLNRPGASGGGPAENRQRPRGDAGAET